MIAFYLLGLAVGVFGLVKVTNKLIHLIKVIGHRLGWSTFVVSSVFLAMATSFPELFVGITSSLEGLGELSLGNILGANLTNVTLVLGLATIISNGVVTKEKRLTKNLVEVGLIALAPYLLLLDKELSRIDGAVLLLIFGIHTLFLVEKEKTAYRLPDSYVHNRETPVRVLVIRLIGWLVVLGGLAQIVVFSASGLAETFTISAFIVGLLVLSLGTTLPELVVEIKSADNREPGIFFGNIFGSLTVNSSLILGLVCLIRPIKLGYNNGFFIPGYVLLLVFILLPIFMRSKFRLERREGFVFLLIYGLFLISEII